MSLEYVMYIPKNLKIEEFTNALASQHLPFDFFSSDKHHPNSILLHRTHFSKKVLAHQFENFPKTTILYFPTPNTLFPLNSITTYLNQCKHSQIVPIIILQGIEESLSASSFTQHPDFDSDHFHETLTKWMLQGADCLFTDSTKESVDFIQRTLEILTKAPYRPDASIHRIHGRKLKPNTEIPESQKNWALQLINIPGISESKALKILERFPKLSDLFEFYLDERNTNSDKKNLFLNISERREKRLSEKVWGVFSSLNESEPV